MLKSLSINNDRYYSHNKKRKIKKRNPNNMNIALLNNNSKNDIDNSIKIFPNNRIKNSNTCYNASNNKVYKTIEGNKKPSSKSRRNKNIFKYLIYNDENSKIINAEKFLTQNEKKFRRNVSQKIINNKKLNDKLIDNITLLNTKINDNYKELTKSKYNFYNANKNIIQTLFNDNRLRLQSKNNNDKKYDLNNDIYNIKNKIEECKQLTNLYYNNYLNIKNEVSDLKKKCKILPDIISNLELENKDLLNKQIILHSNIQKIKLKIIELEKNKKKIGRNLNQINMLYK